MNTTTDTNVRRDGVITAIGIIVLLIATATGNAFAMLAAALVALAAIAIVFRNKSGSRILAAIATALVVGIAVAAVMAKV